MSFEKFKIILTLILPFIKLHDSLKILKFCVQLENGRNIDHDVCTLYVYNSKNVKIFDWLEQFLKCHKDENNEKLTIMNHQNVYRKIGQYVV